MASQRLTRSSIRYQRRPPQMPPLLYLLRPLRGIPQVWRLCITPNLYEFGFCGNLQCMLESFVNDRTPLVRTHNTISSLFRVCCISIIQSPIRKFFLITTGGLCTIDDMCPTVHRRCTSQLIDTIRSQVFVESRAGLCKTN